MPKLSFLLPLIVLALLPASALADEAPPVGPTLSLSPSPVSFEKTTAGEESSVVSVDVENAGGAGGSVDTTAIEGTDASDFKFNGSDCGWIEPGGHCTVWVKFAPGSVGEKTATLAVRVKEAPEATVSLVATAVAPQLDVSPASLEFGIVRVNQGSSQDLQVTNGGEAGTRIGWVGVEGKDTGNFWTGNSDCFNGRWLAPGESCWIQVNFNAWQAVAYEAALAVYADNVSFSAALHGTGGEAMLMPEINPVEFGSAAVGGEGTVRTIHLSNEGNIGGGFFIAVIAGGDVGSFELIDENCTGEEIAPGGTCVAHVRFDPVGLGLKVARLAMFGDSNGGAMVFLRGEGEPAAAEGSSAISPAPKQAKSARKKRAFAHGYALELGRRCKRVKLCNHPKVFSARRAESH